MIVLFVISSGCAQARELNSLIIVMGIGMDVDTETEGNVKIIAQIVLPQKVASGGESSSGGEGKAFVNLSSSSKNTFDAVREYTHSITGKLYISHNQIIVIGRELAERGISHSLDFFVRAKEMRPTVNFLIADTTAEEVLGAQTEMNMMPAIYIDKLVDAQENTSQAFSTDMIDYIDAMQSKTLSLVIPIVRLVTSDGQQIQMLDGMAVFKGDQMVGKLSQEQTRGLLWTKGNVTGGLINVEIDEGIASLEILEATGKTKPMVSEDGKVTMHISVSAKVRLAEQTCARNLSTEESLHELEGLVKQTIIKKIGDTFQQAKALGADVFGFGELIHKYRNDVWGEMEPRWDEIFQTISLEITADASVVSVGSIEEPAWDKEGQP